MSTVETQRTDLQAAAGYQPPTGVPWRDVPWRHAAAAAAIFLGLEALTTLDRSRYLIVGGFGGAFAAALWYATSALRAMSRRALAVLAGACALSLLLVLLSAVFAPEKARGILAEGIFPTLAGWTALLVLLRVPETGPSPVPREDWRPSRRQVAWFLAAVFVLLAVVHWLAVGRWAIVGDEIVMLAQSRWMGPAGLSWAVDPSLADFFRMRKVEYVDGHLYTTYAPGWPALLALFRGAGLEWWSSVILGTVSVGLLYALGARLVGPAAGAGAAVLMATSQWFAMSHAGYMSHAATICASLAAAYCLVVGAEPASRHRGLLWFAAGALLGYGVTVRPLAGLALVAIMGVWTLARLGRAGVRHVPLLAAAMALGAAAPAALLVLHNLAVYGEAVTTGYSMMGPGYSLGFGPRGVTALDAELVRHSVPFDFSPTVALASLVRRLVGLNTAFLPVGLLLPVAAVALAFGFRAAWSRVAIFAILPAAQFFYWGSTLRHYTELLPFVLLAVAAMVVFLHRVRPRFATALAAAMLAGSAVIALPWPMLDVPVSYRRWANFDYGGEVRGRTATIEMADSLAREHGRIVLFAREAPGFDNLQERLYLFNGDKMDGPVLVARDLGARNAELMRRVPDRVPFVVIDRGRIKRADLVPLTDW